MPVVIDELVAKTGMQTDKLFLTLSGEASTGLICVGARIKDGLSVIPEMRMEFLSVEPSFDPKDVLGTRLTLAAENGFRFSGIVISVEDLGHRGGVDFFAAELRPWPWLLTIGSENRVFQGMSAVEIVKKVFAAAGFTDVTDKSTGAKAQREYCVQYGESNFAFVSRLLEEDGIYYFFDHSGPTETIVLADSVSAHTNDGTVKFTTGNLVGDKQGDSNSVFEWAELGQVVTGKVTLFDYEMATPIADLKVSSAVKVGKHSHTEIERYEAVGHYKVAEKGEDQARAATEGFADGGLRASGVTNAPIVTSGAIFTLEYADREAASGTYLVRGCTHYLLFDAGYKDFAPDVFNRHVERIDYPAAMALFETEFEVQLSSVQFRPPRNTPWPAMPSLMTAIVTGPEGDEIHTDEYGRIKVQFYWDRLGSGKEDSSCWVRSVMPWGGKDWGMLSIPRIGMEVVIQFERGNIDRPYCTGVVYNATNMPPYKLAGEMTKTGIRTNSTKGGGGFHELTFDDKKDEESIFFQSEKDYKQLIKNNAEITIGMEKKDQGDLTQTIYRHKTETLKTGDYTFTIEDGNRITTIKKDDTEKIDGKQDLTIKGDQSQTVTEGNKSDTVTQGNSTVEVSLGNQTTTVDAGDIKIDATAGKIAISAGTEITLTVGSTKITIGPAGVKIEGPMITLDGKAMTEVKAPIVKVAGSGMVDVQGAMVKIN